MYATAATRLLADLEPLDYPARMRLLAARTRELAADGELDGVLDVFAAGDEYQRQSGLSAAKIAGRVERIIAGLDDPLYRFRVQALVACVRIPGERTDAAVLATLDDAPLDWRKRLTHAVGAAGRTDLADRLVTGERPQLADVASTGEGAERADRLATADRARLGDREVAALLAACSADVAGSLLPELAHLVPNWAKLGARHPELVLAYVRGELSGLAVGARDGWWVRFGGAMTAVAERRPHDVLDLLEEFPPPSGLPHTVLARIQVLLRADTVRAVRVLTVPDDLLKNRWRALSRSTQKLLAATGLPELERVGCALRDTPAEFGVLLRQLPPSARAAFYDAVTADQDAASAILDLPVLDALPYARRHAEVRRMLKLDALADRPERRLVLTARLPWDEALPDLRTAVRRADPDERAAAYPLLIGCAAADGSTAAVTDLIVNELSRLRNEQDPVRLPALNALAAVPAELFEPSEALTEALLRLVTDAIEARDCSHAGREALRRLACRILAGQVAAAAESKLAPTAGNGATPAAGGALAPTADASPGTALLAWSVAALERLAGSAGSLPLGRLDRSLRRGQEHAVYQALEPWIVRGVERADHRLPLALARALGRRAWDMPALQQHVEHAIWHDTVATSRAAIELWLDDPRHRDERVSRLVAWDPTTATMYRVAQTLSLRRTDLLGPFLDGTVVSGRFIASGAIWVPGLYPSRRWLPRQLAAYGKLLARIAGDAGAKVPARVNAIRGLGGLPGESRRTVLRYVDSTNVPLAEAALVVLAWSDDPAAMLPVLLGYADGDRARVAVYAATRAARFARPSAAASALRSVAFSPTAKVTSRKEVLRIAAELEIPGLIDLLEEAWRLPGQHRDVKAAAVSRLAARMDDPRVPPMLRAAIADDPVIAATLLRLGPLTLPDRHRAAYGELIAAVCDLPDPKVSVAAVMAAPTWYRWAPSVADAVCRAVTDLDRRGERTAPPATLRALLRHGMPLTQYTAVLQTLLDADAAEMTAATGVLAEAGAADTAESADIPGESPIADPPDLPARRRLAAVTAVADPGIRGGDLAHRRRVLRATADALAGHAGYVRASVDFAAAAVDLSAAAEDVTAQLLDLAARADGRHDAAAAAADRLAQAVASSGRTDLWNAESVLVAAEVLAGQADPVAGLLAIRLAAAAGGALGWPGPYRQLVRILRRHPSAAVAEAALEADVRPR